MDGGDDGGGKEARNNTVYKFRLGPRPNSLCVEQEGPSDTCKGIKGLLSSNFNCIFKNRNARILFVAWIYKFLQTTNNTDMDRAHIEWMRKPPGENRDTREQSDD